MKHLAWIAALVACALAGAALAVALVHAGPPGRPGARGPAGPPGPRGQAVTARQSRYGVCWSYTTQTSSDGTATWVTGVTVDSPQISNGVYQCPQGETFTTIQPLPVSTP